MKVIGILGGTFDPVHNGHLQMAQEARENLTLDEVRLVPCHRPPHRDTPTLSSEQRLALLHKSTENIEGLIVDDRELRRDKPSYSVDTLLSFRSELGDDVSLVFLMGMDAYAQLTHWYQWQRLRELAHIAVMTRPNSVRPTQGILAKWLGSADEVTIAHRQAAGGFFLLQQSLLAISATEIRQRIAQGKPMEDMPLRVGEYLKSLTMNGKEKI